MSQNKKINPNDPNWIKELLEQQPIEDIIWDSGDGTNIIRLVCCHEDEDE